MAASIDSSANCDTRSFFVATVFVYCARKVILHTYKQVQHMYMYM